jgi:hypothetical protein
VLERAQEVFGCQVATDVAVNAGAVDIERARDVLFYFIVSIGHESPQIITVHRLRRFHRLRMKKFSSQIAEAGARITLAN